MVVVQELTAEALLSAPRRGAAVPNRSGKLALYTVSTHDFGTHKTTKEVRVMDLATGSSQQLSGDEKVHDAVWIPGTDDEVVYLKSGEKGLTELLVANAAETEAEHYVAAKFEAPVANVKLKALDDGIAFVVTGLVGDDGALYNEETAEKPSTARVFDSMSVRVWNDLFKAQRYSLWYSKLVLQDDKWKLDGELHCLVTDPKLDAPTGMYGVDDPLGHFDICQRGIAFGARRLSVRKLEAGIADSSPFFVSLDSFTSPPPGKPAPISLGDDDGVGVCTNVRISPDASMIGLIYVDMKDPHNPRLFMTSIDELAAFDVLDLVTNAHDKDRDPPTEFEFAGSSDSLIIKRTECGRVALGHLKLHDGEEPKIFFKQGTAVAYYPVTEGNWDRLLITSNSLIDSSLWQIVDVTDGNIVKTVSSATKDGAKLGLSADMVTEFWLEMDDDQCFHSFLLRPKDFDKEKKYPWILAPHGGPESQWSDGWSTRWNLLALAAQGYIVVLPNISGSTGYGVEFTKRIDNEWGGNPYNDLLRLIQYLETLPYLDQDKGIIAGASYGGYMVSWMMGFDVIEKFCGAIWHDGLYDMRSTLIQSDFVETELAFGGPPYYWSNPEGMQRFNPASAERLRNWSRAPPTLVIHSEKDYRCPITDGIAVFKTLQVHRVPSRFLTFPDECHWVLGAENSLVWHREVWGWIKRCVEGDIKRGDTEW